MGLTSIPVDPRTTENAGDHHLGPAERPGSVWRWPDRRPWGPFGLFALTAAAYAAGAQIAQLILELSGLSAVFFIPAGVTVAFLLRLRRLHWWIVLLAAAGVEATTDLISGIPLDETAGFVAANSLEPLVGALIVGRFCESIDLARLRHVWAFFVGAVLAGPAVGAAIGATTVLLLGGGDVFLATFGQWWLGDALGVVILGSAILVWGSSPDRRSLVSAWGAALLGGTLVLAVGTLTFIDVPIEFLVVVGIVIAGALFGVRAVAVSAAIAAVGIALEVVLQTELIIGMSEASALTVLTLQLGVLTLAGLVVSAEAAEREVAIANSVASAAREQLAEANHRAEHDIAVRLQRALLPDRHTRHPDVSVAARYEAGTDAMLVGGDWYDVFDLPGGRIGVTVGDVVGHGLEATAAMGRLRTAVAAFAHHTDSPSVLLTQLDEFAAGPNGTEFATAAYAILDPPSGLFKFASAGHPPMLVIRPAGEARWLHDGRSPPLHGSLIAGRPEAAVQLEPGSLVITYSDGLIERKDQDLQTGLDSLEREAVRLADKSPEEICDVLLEAMGLGPDRVRGDDVVVVAVRYEPKTYVGADPA